jgi:hypothetical protein
MDDFARQEVHIRDKPAGLLWEADKPNAISRIWVKTWAQIIHECRTRLKIFQQALEYSADKDASLDYLKKTYERVLHGAEIADSVETVDAEVSATKSSGNYPPPHRKARAKRTTSGRP